ncbi:MAG: hypothetical protein ACFFDW_15405 [Candidatus Thorarchaeota archaeon]
MVVVIPQNTAIFLDELNEKLFYNKEIPEEEWNKLAEIIVTKLQRKGREKGCLALSAEEYFNGAQLFTGEKMNTKLAIKNILTLNALSILKSKQALSEDTIEAISIIEEWIVNSCFSKFCTVGECKHSTLGYLYYLANLTSEEKYDEFLAILKHHRDGTGRWKGFPYFYTLYILLLVNTSEALEELQYSASVIEKNYKFISTDDKYSQRRKELLQRVMSKIYEVF